MFLTWGVMAVFQMQAAAATDTGTPPSAFGMVLFLLGGFSPTIAGVIMAWRVQERDGLRDLWKRSVQFRLGGVWYLAILGLPLLVRGLQVVSFVVALMSFVVVMTWLYNNTEGSMLLAMLMHLVFKVAVTLAVMPLETQMAILAGLYLIFALVVTLVTGPGKLSRRSEKVTK